ncbi:Putative protein C10orf67 [Chelonia mydas]|uniref:DUF4709 domain-containing protein n=1 Tax=Chelonia mydas TaxID=8469 RepID=M7BY62_CHEMY|nr:Putative protein C10orf67 [Chelonia mydas]
MSSISAGRKLSPSPHILELLALPCCLEELEADCRPSISDDLKVGYFITDHATQTDIKEIVELKELTTTTQALVQFTDSIQQDFMIYKNVLQAQYEEKIQEQASNLCRQINDRLRDIEAFHKQKEVKIRQSYQQQLCDALAVLRVDYELFIPNMNSSDKEVRGMQLKMEKDEKTVQKRGSLQSSLAKRRVAMMQRFEDELGHVMPPRGVPPPFALDYVGSAVSPSSESSSAFPSPSSKSQQIPLDRLPSSSDDSTVLDSSSPVSEDFKSYQDLLSLHAIKDEMFLRHALYRQAASFNQASLNQTLAVPLYIETGASQINERRGALYLPFSPLLALKALHTPDQPLGPSTEIINCHNHKRLCLKTVDQVLCCIQIVLDAAVRWGYQEVSYSSPSPWSSPLGTG